MLHRIREPRRTGPRGYENGCHHHVGHSLGHGPCEESHGHVEEMVSDHHDVGSDDGLNDVQAHDQSRSAKKQKEEYEPTDVKSVYRSERSVMGQHTSIFKRSSRPTRLLCIS